MACATLVDLTTADAGAGAGPIVYRTDTSTTPLEGGFGFPCVTNATRIVHTVALRYRMHGTAFLRVDTATALTPTNFDTVAGVFASCTQNMAPLDCNDDAGDGDPRARIVSRAPYSAGTDLVIVVGGFDPVGPTGRNAGPLEVDIAEPTAVAVGSACDTTAVTSRCMTGGCATVRTGSGVCAAELAEVENNARTTPQLISVATPALVRGQVGAPGDAEDCYAMDVAAGGSLVLVPTDGAGACPSPYERTAVTLYDATGATVVQAMGTAPTPLCPSIDGTSNGPAHALAAARYVACITQPDALAIDYLLSISVLP
jgi:hypothetical protein